MTRRPTIRWAARTGGPERQIRAEVIAALLAEGAVDLRGAHVGGTLLLHGARLAHPGEEALDADRLTVRGHLTCTELAVEGEVTLTDAEIGASADLSGARLVNPRWHRPAGRRPHRGEQPVLPRRFTAEGTVRLRGARLNSTLEMDGARLVNPGGHALSASRLRVAESVFFREGFTAEGEVRLLDGSTGGGFNAPDLPARWRIAWISRSAGGYAAQPYEQLAAHYRRLGHDEQARGVVASLTRALSRG